MEENKKGLVVVAIENGTVIDQIPPDKLFKVVSILNLDRLESQITVGNNLKSNKIGSKGIIKISDIFFEPNVINKIALIAPNAKLNIIKNFQVVEKRHITLPEEIHDIMHCTNPKCVTNNEPVPTFFHVVDKVNVKLKCHYCEKMVEQGNVEIK
jgi:aspartate carbamoyltransferase regulatory subunit